MDKKEKVIKAAKELFEKYGFKRVSMNEIASLSGVTKKTIYTYFKDKEDLIKYFLNEEVMRAQKIADDIENNSKSIYDKIHDLVICSIDYRTSSKILDAFARENDAISRECIEIYDGEIQRQIKIKLDKASRDNLIKNYDTDILSFIIYKIYISLMLEWDKPIDKKKAADAALDILKNGLLK